MRLRPHRCPAALAYMSAGPYDVRPHLISLFYSGDMLALEPVLAYGRNYLRAWCNAAGVMRPGDAIAYAVADGLMRLYRPRAVMPADDRARLLRMRAEAFRRLVNQAHRAYRLRLMEGAERFIPAAIGSDDTPRGLSDPHGFRVADWWNSMHARTGRPEHHELAHLEIGDCRSPAHRPRAPPRDTGGYSNSIEQSQKSGGPRPAGLPLSGSRKAGPEATGPAHADPPSTP